MTREQAVRAALLELQETRGRNSALREKNIEHVAKLYPEIINLLHQKRSLLPLLAQAAFDAPEKVPEMTSSMRKKWKDIENEISSILARFNLPPDYIQPVYDCAACRDSGYVGEPVRSFCDCMQARITRNVLSGGDFGFISPDIAITFGSFDLSIFPDIHIDGKPSQREQMRRIRDLSIKYIEKYPDISRPNMLFTGKSGLGKTYLIKCMLHAACMRGINAAMVTAYKMLEHFRQYHMQRNDAGAAMNGMLEADILFIDDLGTEPMLDNITVEYLYALLNERLLGNKATIIASNLSMRELGLRYTERILSRISDVHKSLIIQFLGDDVRMIKRTES